MEHKHKLFAVLFIIILSISLFRIATTSAEAPVETNEPAEGVTEVVDNLLSPLSGKEYYLSLVEKYAIEYNVSATTMKKVISCENNTWDPKRQSDIINSKGERENSWGLSQIHLPSHPHISREQAQDPEFSIEFMAKAFSKGQQTKWSCYKKLFL